MSGDEKRADLPGSEPLQENADLRAVLMMVRRDIKAVRDEMGSADDLLARQHALSVAAWWLKKDSVPAAAPGVVHVAELFLAFLTPSPSGEKQS